MNKHKGLRILLGVLGGLALLAAGVWGLLFRVNRFTILLTPLGQAETILEYGQEYREPGAGAVLTGTLLWKEGIPLENPDIRISGEVNPRVLGRYEVDYRLDFLGCHAQARRRVTVVDTQCPVITLKEDPQDTPLRPGAYLEPGFTATDNYDGDITDRVICQQEKGVIRYAVVDSSGNPAYAQREIPFFDPDPPEIVLEGGETFVIPVGSFYQEPGYRATDEVDGDLTDRVTVEGEVDWLTPGTYPITYTVADGWENVATVTREVRVEAQPRPEVLWPGRKTIYLTFDDGPGPYTGQLLDVLDRYGVKATFFVTDSGYDDMMAQIVRRGHSIGIHTVTHDYGQIYSSPEAYFEDLHRMQDIIYENTGVRTTLMRFPGGSSNTVSRESCQGVMTVLSEAVQDAGFQYFDWNVDSDDAGSARKAKTVYDNVVEGIRQTGVSLVLQHDIHPYSVEAVEDILQWGLNNGYTFAPLTQNSPGFHHGVNN